MNAVIGQGIFLLPGMAAALLGPASIMALLIASILAFMIALCFAEVGSRFKTTGGAYAYARGAFGPLVGFEVGWMLCVVCVVSWAALATGFTLVLGYFFPQVTEGWLQPAIAVSIMTVMVGINLRGAKIGGTLSTIFSVAKLVPLLLFVGAGLYAFDPTQFTPFSPQGYDQLPEAVLLLLYTLVGFESSVVPAGEMENPQKAVPLSLLSVMTLVVIIYVGVFVACISLHPEMAGAKSPVSDAAAVIFGSRGAALIAAGIVISSLGINAVQALVGPRKIFAMAERGDLPEALSLVDEKTGVPKNAILATYAVAVLLVLTGSFKSLAMLGVLARFVQYIATCGALIVYRRRDAAEGVAQGFRIPGGPAIAVATIGIILWLIYKTPPEKIAWGLVAMLIGLPFYYLSRDDEETA